MAADVEPVKPSSGEDGAPSLTGARLQNFRTGFSQPLQAHEMWVRGTLRQALEGRRDPWIDIAAYASKRGDARRNQALSERRRDAVKGLIAAAVPGAKFLKQEAWGASHSGGGASDNDGRWRAVEVFAYEHKPPGRVQDVKPPPPPPKPFSPLEGVDEWFVTNLSLTGGTIVAGFGGGAFTGSIKFEHVGSGKDSDVEGSITLAGVAVGESFGVSALQKVPWIGKALKFMGDNAGGSLANLPSETAGMCFRNPINTKRLESSSFKGGCATVFVSGALGPGGATHMLLLFGLPSDFWTSRTTIALLAAPPPLNAPLGPLIIARCKGVAVLSSAGLGLGLSVTASVNAMGGAIS